jgi:hypothetical protein
LYEGNDPGSAGLPNTKPHSELTMSDEKVLQSHPINYGQILALRGLRLPAITLKGLQTAGIHCQPAVSIEHQHLARRYVLRGVESGGAVADLGAYCGFVEEDGQPMSWLQRVDSIAVNGVHGVVISAGFARLQMLRVQRTYDLLITRHSLPNMEDGKRPRLESSILFYGRRGTLEMDLSSKDAAFRGKVSPVFYSRSGEPASLPGEFQDAVVRVTAAASCVGCRHCHLLQPGAVVSGSVVPEMGEVSP